MEPVFSCQESSTAALSANLKEKGDFFGERLVSTWQLHKHHLCLSFAPHQLHHTRRPARTQTQTLLRCSVNSAAPLALYTYTSCTQTFHRVNTQRSTPNAKWAARAQGTEPASTFYLEYQVQTTFPPPPPPKSTCNGSTSSTHKKCVPLPEVRLAKCCKSAQVSKSQWRGRGSHHRYLNATLSSGESPAVSRQDRCPQCWIIWPQRRPWSIQLMCLLHWKQQEKNSKLPEAFCGVLKEELRGQALHFTVLLSSNSGCWYVNG